MGAAEPLVKCVPELARERQTNEAVGGRPEERCEVSEPVGEANGTKSATKAPSPCPPAMKRTPHCRVGNRYYTRERVESL